MTDKEQVKLQGSAADVPTNKLVGLKRWFKHKFIKLMRAPGGSAKVALGFSIGIAIEMITLPTFGLAFLLMFPLVYLMKASMAGALSGFVFGKIIFIPIAFLSGIVGGWILPDHLQVDISFLPQFVNKFIEYNLKLIVGGFINGTLLGILFYFPVRYGIAFFTERRRKKRKLKRKDTPTANPVTE
ncbi:DUF2062 domain-containing protein [Paenibacillus xylaniclasticus]|uniref:DUF2062 domain-containing protein n=1 Tax=Paenibacillus xylaniclasticus TaxID=588083 RepID=UPI000FD7C454|nr:MULTISPECIES: DUF2062 domain-containing protein [Paenibacillus]GFN31630.1 hypothetical protein PCURB6_18900 [Paenibacillus curdlanolyticus]